MLLPTQFRLVVATGSLVDKVVDTAVLTVVDKVVDRAVLRVVDKVVDRAVLRVVDGRVDKVRQSRLQPQHLLAQLAHTLDKVVSSCHCCVVDRPSCSRVHICCITAHYLQPNHLCCTICFGTVPFLVLLLRLCALCTHESWSSVCMIAASICLPLASACYKPVVSASGHCNSTVRCRTKSMPAVGCAETRMFAAATNDSDINEIFGTGGSDTAQSSRKPSAGAQDSGIRSSAAQDSGPRPSGPQDSGSRSSGRDGPTRPEANRRESSELIAVEVKQWT